MRRDKTQNLKEELAPRVVEACGAKNAPSVSPLPMLVRACLGRMIVFMYGTPKMAQKGRHVFRTRINTHLS